MPTHESPPSDIAPVLLGLTEEDTFWLTLASRDDVHGTVLSAELTPQGDHFNTPARLQLEFEASGVAFELTMAYREDDDGVPTAESLDFRLVENPEWSIPITVDIETIHR